MNLSPESQGLNKEGEPLPGPAAIDLPAADADKDADGGEETKTAEEEPADSDHDHSNDDSERLPFNPSNKKKAKHTKETAPSDHDSSSREDADARSVTILTGSEKKKKRPVAADATPNKKTTSKGKKRKKRTQTTPPTGNPLPRTPPSIGSHMSFPTKKKLEHYSQSAAKNLREKKIVGYELKERTARKMVKNHSNETHLEVSNGMLPWMSELGLSDDNKTIFLYRNKMNHNTISPNLSNEITNNFLDNPIRADLKGKVHSKDMGSDMTCILTYNTKVSVNTILETFYNL